jgi:hypothetical protein
MDTIMSLSLRKRCSEPVIALLVFSLVLGPGCATKTQITTDPGGVEVVLDGQSIGQSTEQGLLTLERSWGAFPSEHTLTLAREKYKSRTVQLQSSYHADASLLWLLAGIVPYFFSARFEHEYHFELDPDISEGVRPISQR